MPKKRGRKNSSKKYVFAKNLVWHLLKLPYHLYRAIRFLFTKTKQLSHKQVVRKKRKQLPIKYQDFKIISSTKGDYAKWRDSLSTADSKIGIILGARGTGKTALALKLLENVHVKTGRACFAMGFSESELPIWIKGVDGIEKIKNNSFVVIDEGGILFSSRKSMSKANTILSNLILVARHKNISILFISQNSSNLEINVLRQADFLLLKPSSLLQKDFERKIVRNIYDGAAKEFEDHKTKKGLTYIYSDLFTGFITNALPSFWKEAISKSFK